jgi:hypothetical protein
VFFRSKGHRAKLSLFEKLVNEFSKFDQNSLDFQHEVDRFLKTKKAGKVFKHALENPNFFRLGPLLFSRKIHTLVADTPKPKATDGENASDQDRREKEIAKEQMIATVLIGKLDQLIIDSPFKLGFSGVISFQKLQFKHFNNHSSLSIFQLIAKAVKKHYGLEASLMAMKLADFYPQLTTLEKDALHVHEAMRQICSDRGHTFLHERDVESFKFYFEYDKEFSHNFVDILAFLCSPHEVVKLEPDLYKSPINDRFYLMRHWTAEEGVKEKIVKLSKNASSYLVKFSKPVFERIRKDPHQMKAAQLIDKNAVTLISGRGGTGKTEVVSTVLNEIEAIIGLDKARAKKECDYYNRLICHCKNDDQDSADDIIIKEDAEIIKTNRAEYTSNLLLPDPFANYDVKVDITDVEIKIVAQFSKWMTENGKDNPLSRVWKDDPKLRLDAVKDNEEDLDEKETELKYVLCVAPTGKAASVMRKRTGKKAFTIHQILASYKMNQKIGSDIPWKYSYIQVIAVDECSMVSVELFHMFLKYMFQEAKLIKIILLGDLYQLPSIDPGNFMEDLFYALKPHGFVAELKTNHRSEGSLIFDNAEKIRNQHMPMFAKGFQLITHKKPINLPGFVKAGAHILAPVTKISDQVKLRSTFNELQIPMEKQSSYLSLLRNHRDQFNLDDQRTSQFIAFKNVEADYVNQICCKVYNNHLIFEHPDGDENKKIIRTFFMKDKIMCTKNNDITIMRQKEDNNENIDKMKNEIQEGLENTAEKKDAIYIADGKDRLMNGSVFELVKVRYTNLLSVELKKNILPFFSDW